MLGDRGVTKTLFATPRAGYRVPTPLPISASIRFQPTPFAGSVVILFVFRIIFGQPALFRFAFAVRSPAYTRTVGSWLFAEADIPLFYNRCRVISSRAQDAGRYKGPPLP